MPYDKSKPYSCPCCGYWNGDMKEDYYKHEKPHIEDEKVRKVVRAWADNLRDVMCDGEISFYVDEAFCTFQTDVWKTDTTRDIAELDLVFDYNGLDDNKIYTIAELCGEEEE